MLNGLNMANFNTSVDPPPILDLLYFFLMPVNDVAGR